VAVRKSKKPSLRIRVTQDLTVNLDQKYWFIEVENYFWLRYVSKHFRNVTFEDWMNYQLEPIRRHVNIKVLARRKPKQVSPYLCVAGWYDTFLDMKKRKPISLIIYRHGWPTFSRIASREHFLNYMIKTLIHELNHQKQSRKKLFKNYCWDGEYLADPDEIDSYALNAAQSLVARFGVDGAIKRATSFRTKDKHCCEFHDYAALEDNAVQQKFIKRVFKYIEVYRSYQAQHGEDSVYSHRIHRASRRTRRQIKSQAHGA